MRHREHFQPPGPIPKTYNTLSVFSVLFGAFLQVPCKVLSKKRPLCRIFSGILSVFQCRYRNFCRQRSGAALGCPMRSGPAKVLKTPFKNLHRNRQKGAKPANCHHFCLTTGKSVCKTLQKTYKEIYSRSITSGAHLGGTAELRSLRPEARDELPRDAPARRQRGATQAVMCYTFFTFGSMEGFFHGKE